MTCDHVRQLQSNYIDEELIGEVRNRIDAHLAECRECRADYEAVTMAVARLHHAPPSEGAAPWFTDRVLERLARENEVSDVNVFDAPASQLSFKDL